jgi:hypothetical protein
MSQTLQLVPSISSTNRVGDWGKAVGFKAGPLLKLNVESSYVDMPSRSHIQAAAARILEICKCCRRVKAASLETEAAYTKEDFDVGLKALVMPFVAGAQEVRVLADIAGRDGGDVNVAFDSQVLTNIVVAVDGDALDVWLRIVGTDERSCGTDLYRGSASGGWDGLRMRPVSQTKDAGETADKNMPLQQLCLLVKQS